MLFIIDIKASQNRYNDQDILNHRQKNKFKTTLKACEKTKNCLIMNGDTHLYYETRFLFIL